MRITGKFQSIGAHLADGDVFRPSIIVMLTDDDVARAATSLLNATVDIYPHPVNGLLPGECTPENYAHALARLAHAEAQDDGKPDYAAREEAWSEFLMLRRRIREAPEADKADLVNRALTLGRLHKFDPPARELEEAQAHLLELAISERRLRLRLAKKADDLAAARAELRQVTAERDEARETIEERDRTIVDMQNQIDDEILRRLVAVAAT